MQQYCVLSERTCIRSQFGQRFQQKPVQIADEEIARIPGWLARLHCPDLCLSCHFCSPAGYLIFCHGMALPEAVLQSVFSDYEQWSYEADVDGHEGVFYTCNATQELNEEVGDLEQRIIALEVC